jgi:hypothetical protein
VKKAKCSRRQSLTLAVFNDAEEITSGPKTTLGARLFVTVKESQVVLLTERGARRLRDSEECQAVGRQSLEWVCFEALKNVHAIRRQSLERVVFMTIGNASGPKTRLGKKLQRKQDPRKSKRSEDKTWKGKWHSSNGAFHGIKRVLVRKPLSKDPKERASDRKQGLETCYERKAKLSEDKTVERNDNDIPDPKERDPKERPSGLKTALGRKLD